MRNSDDVSFTFIGTHSKDADEAIAANAASITELDEIATENGDSIKQNNVSIIEVDATVDLVEEKQEVLGGGLNAQQKVVGTLNKTVADLQTTIDNFADPNADPTIKQQVALISDAMKEYGLYTQCEVGSWSGFGECSHDCDGGTQKRTRAIKPLPGYARMTRTDSETRGRGRGREREREREGGREGGRERERERGRWRVEKGH